MGEQRPWRGLVTQRNRCPVVHIFGAEPILVSHRSSCHTHPRPVRLAGPRGRALGLPAGRVEGMPTPEFITTLRKKIGHDPLFLPGVTAIVLKPVPEGAAVW